MAPENPGPFWIRSSRVSEVLGFTQDLFLASVAAGQIPIRTEAFGERGIYYSSSADLKRYLESALSPAAPAEVNP